MQPFHLRIYLTQVSVQAIFARIATQTLERGLHPTTGSAFEAFAGAQGLLTAAAQMANLLWPHANAKRGTELRAIIQPHEILERRTVRNSVEHFDERLDRTFRTHKREPISDLNLSAVAAIDAPHGILLRNLDPVTLVYSALDDQVNLRDLFAATEAAGASADRWLSTPGTHRE